MIKLKLTDNALNHLENIVKENNKKYVRLDIVGGGCAGFEYIWGLSTDDGIEHVKWSDPIEDVLVLDPVAEMYVIGSEIDYVTELGGSFLTVRNPTAASSCGCGESFGI